MRPEIQAEVDRVIAGFRQECLRVLGETRQLRGSLPEPPEGWREYFTRRIYTALLKYKEEIEAVVEAHLQLEEPAGSSEDPAPESRPVTGRERRRGQEERKG